MRSGARIGTLTVSIDDIVLWPSMRSGGIILVCFCQEGIVHFVLRRLIPAVCPLYISPKVSYLWKHVCRIYIYIQIWVPLPDIDIYIYSIANIGFFYLPCSFSRTHAQQVSQHSYGSVWRQSEQLLQKQASHFLVPWWWRQNTPQSEWVCLH